MDTPISSDIFKFMSLRAAQNYSFEKDVSNFIRDNRIVEVNYPDGVNNIALDEEKFSNSDVAKFVFERIKHYLPIVESTKVGNDFIADEVKTKFSSSEKIDRQHITEFIELIELHLVNFNKDELIAGLNHIVKKAIPKFSDTKDYLEILADNDLSHFCFDYYHLYEKLYALYICKRRYPINLEYVLDGLRALHVLLWLSFESDDIKQNQERKGCLPKVLQNIQTFLKGIFQRTTLSATKKEERISKKDLDPELEAAEGIEPKRNLCAASIITSYNSNTSFRIRDKEDLAKVFGATPLIHPMLAYLLFYYKPFNDIRPIGIGDLLVVKQFLCKYEAGEIAHVENVLKGETKERTHRRLDRTESMFSLETEKTEETEKDLQTTERFELRAETENTIQDDLNTELTASVSGKYGMVDFAANTGVSYNRSTSDSRRSASNYAKDTIDRTLTRIQKRVREERLTKQVFEVEEINKHGVNNSGGNGHVTGIYRWLNKRYKAQVFNYGKRMMFEFIIPQPAEFLKAAFEHNKKKANKPNKPLQPARPALVIDQINDATVSTYAALYNLSDLKPMPPDNVAIRSQPIQATDVGDSTREFTLDIPIGYQAESAKAAGSRQRHVNVSSGLFVAIGGENKLLGGNEESLVYQEFDVTYTQIGSPREKLSIAVLSYGMKSYALNVLVTAKLTPEKTREWQLEIYGRIMDAYEKKMAEYQAALSEYENRLAEYEAKKDFVIQGRNPQINEDAVKTELKKHCITMIARQFDTEKVDDFGFNAMKSRSEKIDTETTVVTEIQTVTQTSPAPDTTVTVTETSIVESTSTVPVNVSIPAIDIDEARKEGNIIQFLEQAFEWPQITYLLYPYFWGHMPEKWFEAQTYFDETDPFFGKFLQAGSVRVLVAVRPAYEVAVLHYLYTQEPWNGGPAPGINHHLYVPIHTELRNQQDDLNGAEPYGDPWNVVVPTTLVYLQVGSELPVFGCGHS